MDAILYELAGLLNRRPLTTVSEDPEDLRPLNPVDLLNRANTATPPVWSFDDALPKEYFRYLQRMLNLFWDQWKKTYLQSLAGRQKWKLP